MQSIIIPIFNGSQWIDTCFKHILSQKCVGKLNLEICVCNDRSKDDTSELLLKWKEEFSRRHINLNIFENTSEKDGGVGYAKNRAVEISKGEYLCFQDVDDLMLPDRILKQYSAANALDKNYIIGTKFKRLPANSTVRYTSWANSLTNEQLNIQVYTANGPTVVMPTWFFHRSVFKRYSFCLDVQFLFSLLLVCFEILGLVDFQKMVKVHQKI